MVFNTKIIDFITELYDNGENWREIFTETPFHEGDRNIRKSGVTFTYSEKELEEYIKCSQDIFYFVEKYCKIRKEDGTIGAIKLRDYQKDYLFNLNNKKKIIVLKARQMGITVMNALYILHYCIFNVDKNILISANLRASTIEVVDKIKSIYINLPFWLKPGIKNWNQSSVIFDTGSKIKTSARSKTPAIGFEIDVLFIEEFAHTPSNIIEHFYRCVKDTSKIVIGSTPNGMNLFYHLYVDATSGKNDFFPIRMDYTLITSRDEKWREQTIKEIGGIEAFEQEYELKFISENGLNGRLKTIENKIDQLSENIEVINDNGDIAKFKTPSNNELLERIDRIERNIEMIVDKLKLTTGDYLKAQKVLEKPGQVTWQDVEAYKKRLEDWKWAQSEYEKRNQSGTSSTPLS